jgi:hypothetical protein
MIPIDQTIYGPEGNCFQACIASILEVPLDDVPECLGGRYDQRLLDWLHSKGLGLVLKPTAGGWLTGYCILTAKSPRTEGNHAVVIKDGEVVHDPHPERDMGIGEWKYLWAFYLLDPAVLVKE